MKWDWPVLVLEKMSGPSIFFGKFLLKNSNRKLCMQGLPTKSVGFMCNVYFHGILVLSLEQQRSQFQTAKYVFLAN